MTLAEQLKQIPAFRNEAGFLSNFAPYYHDEYMKIDHVIYLSNEHFYQAMKFTNKDKQRMISNHDFKGLKGYVRTLGPINPDWDNIRNSVMRTGLEYKFNLPRFKTLLLSTGDEEIVERNTWRDTYWGVYQGKGENRLGKMLMEIRDKLKIINENPNWMK